MTQRCPTRTQPYPTLSYGYGYQYRTGTCLERLHRLAWFAAVTMSVLIWLSRSPAAAETPSTAAGRPHPLGHLPRPPPPEGTSIGSGHRRGSRFSRAAVAIQEVCPRGCADGPRTRPQLRTPPKRPALLFPLGSSIPRRSSPSCACVQLRPPLTITRGHGCWCRDPALGILGHQTQAASGQLDSHPVSLGFGTHAVRLPSSESLHLLPTRYRHRHHWLSRMGPDWESFDWGTQGASRLTGGRPQAVIAFRPALGSHTPSSRVVGLWLPSRTPWFPSGHWRQAGRPLPPVTQTPRG